MADRDVAEVAVFRTPEKLRLTFIKQKSSAAWSRVFDEIKSFIKCRTDCFDESGLSISERFLLPPQPEISTPNLTVPSHGNTPNYPGFPLLSLPVELVLEIFEWVAGDYDLEAYLHSTYETCPLLLFKPARTWKSMKVFHICKALRCLAIRRYGEPDQKSLPFNPIKDKLVISEMIDERAVENLIQKDMAQVSWIEPYQILNGVHCCIMANFGDWETSGDWEICRPRKPGSNFLRRVRRLDICTLSKLQYPPVESYSWGRAFPFLSTTLPNLKTLGISVNHYDSCFVFKFDPDHSNVYKYSNMLFFEDLRVAAEDPLVNEYFEEFCPQLEHVEILQSQRKCGIVFERSYKGPGAESVYQERLGTADIGPEDKWDWKITLGYLVKP
ncbi:hypothetical protein F4781DRAFT_439582 [Annulohypoxylon bovei var. microspora]|nr:hypothetical protein F4781DRAFT_439582 [Annulohypoxylon bovei var. microspora]